LNNGDNSVELITSDRDNKSIIWNNIGLILIGIVGFTITGYLIYIYWDPISASFVIVINGVKYVANKVTEFVPNFFSDKKDPSTPDAPLNEQTDTNPDIRLEDVRTSVESTPKSKTIMLQTESNDVGTQTASTSMQTVTSSNIDSPVGASPNPWMPESSCDTTFPTRFTGIYEDTTTSPAGSQDSNDTVRGTTTTPTGSFDSNDTLSGGTSSTPSSDIKGKNRA
jgi:hypothetical protein